MGTEYQIINLTEKVLCGFGVDFDPKYRNLIMNRNCARFLLFLMFDKYRTHQIIIIDEGNSWDWSHEIDTSEFEDKSKELLEEYFEWDKELNENSSLNIKNHEKEKE